MKKLLGIIKQNPLLIVITISLLVISLYLLFEIKITDNHLGAPLDDVYIHFQFSKNLAEGNDFSFNSGQPTPGSTSPAWTILITSFYLFIKNHLLIAKVLSAIFYLLTGVTTYYLGLEVFKSKKLALIVSVFTLLTGRFAWSALSGMEVTLFAFLLTLFILLYLKEKSKYLLMLILGLASIVRPEGYLIFIFYLFIQTPVVSKRLFFSKSKLRYSKKELVTLLLSAAIYLSIILPYIIFSFVSTGDFLPNTFAAQSIAESALLFRAKSAVLYLLRYCYLLVIDNPLIAICLPCGLYSLIKRIVKNERYFLIFLITLGFPIFASITAPNLRHHGRYMIPFIPLYLVIGIMGFKMLLTRFKHKRIYLQKAAQNMTIISTLGYLLIMLITWASTFAWNVKNINDMHVHLGNWVSDNISEDSVIALNDIGAITYISQREIIDIVGLVSPEVLEVTKGLSKEGREEPLWNYLLEKHPDYLIILPSWYPQLSQKSELEEIYRVQLDRYTMIDGEMVVYKVNYK